MSKHSMRSRDIAALLHRLLQLQEKARADRTAFQLVVVQEAGLDGVCIHRALQKEAIQRHIVDPASIATSLRRSRAKTDRIDGEALIRVLLAHKRGDGIGGFLCEVVAMKTDAAVLSRCAEHAGIHHMLRGAAARSASRFDPDQIVR
jgi:transposase